MEITDHPDGLQLAGPFDPSDGPMLLAVIQAADASKLHCSSALSIEDGQALADLLLASVQPWLEEQDRRLELVVGSRDYWSILTERLGGSRIQFVGTSRQPDNSG